MCRAKRFGGGGMRAKFLLGHRYRGRQILFTSAEAEEIRQFANRIEPIDQSDANQLKLFNPKRSDLSRV